MGFSPLPTFVKDFFTFSSLVFITYPTLGFSLLSTLGYYSALGFSIFSSLVFYPALGFLFFLPLATMYSALGLPLFPTLGYYPALGLYSAGKNNL